MSRPPTHPKSQPSGPGVEWEYDKLTFDRSFSRNLVRKILGERAEHGGWELVQVALTPDGTRRIVVRRKIIRQRATLWAS